MAVEEKRKNNNTIMGNDTSKAHGTDFDELQRNRERYNSFEDLPVIPFSKQKLITEELHRMIKESIWLTNFKRAYRGFLRRKPERGQDGTQLRIRDQSLRCADELGLPKDSMETLLELLVDVVGVIWYEDAEEYVRERGVVSDEDDPKTVIARVNGGIRLVFETMSEDYVNGIAKSMYDKYSRGADFEMSDFEIDDETRRRVREQQQEALKKAAAEREKRAAEWRADADLEDLLLEVRNRNVEKVREDQKAMHADSLL